MGGSTTTSRSRTSRRPIPVQAASPSSRRPRRLRRLIIAGIVLVVVVAAALLGIGWYFSGQVLDVSPSTPDYSLRVVALQGNTVVLERTDRTVAPGTYALDWLGGRDIVGPVIRTTNQGVVRRFVTAPHALRPGTLVDMDGSMYTSPADLHLRFSTVNVPDPLGAMPAWYIPGKRHTWAVMVHGWRASRVEPLRPVPTLVGLGLPVLDLSYRNDRGVPQSPDHHYHLGSTEWQDVQAGVRYALAHGAQHIVLYGYSMGGATVEQFLHRSVYSNRVQAVVLDAPALDWNALLDLAAGQRHVPGFVTDVAKFFVAKRIGLSSIDDLNQIHKAGALRAPTLLFHGTADKRIPISSSEAFARARPDLVTFVRVPGAAHVENWNVNPAAYDATVKSFLARYVH